MKTTKEYIKTHSHCPHCNSDQLEGRSFDYFEATISQFVDCLDCDATWTDVYTLTDAIIAEVTA